MIQRSACRANYNSAFPCSPIVFARAVAYYDCSALHFWCLPLPPARTPGRGRHQACGAGVENPASAEMFAGRHLPVFPFLFREPHMAGRVLNRRALRDEAAETIDDGDEDDG